MFGLTFFDPEPEPTASSPSFFSFSDFRARPGAVLKHKHNTYESVIASSWFR